MRLPIHYISILGTEWKIEWKPIPDDKDTIGLMSSDIHTITVDPTIPYRDQYNVLCHEITHAILHTSGLAHLIRLSLEEAICDVVGNAFGKILREEEDEDN